jgi:hypothetical protein
MTVLQQPHAIMFMILNPCAIMAKDFFTVITMKVCHSEKIQRS